MHSDILKAAFSGFSSKEALGMAFLRAWSSSFFSSALIFGAFSDMAGWGSTAHNISLFAFMASFLAVGLFSNLPAIKQWVKLRKTAAAITTIGSVLITLSIVIPDAHSILIAVGGVITGIGSSSITISWGSHFVNQGRKNIYWTTLGVYFFASVFALSFSACTLPTIIIFASISPLISVLYLCNTKDGDSLSADIAHPISSSGDKGRFLGFLAYIALTSVVIGSVGAFCNEKTAFSLDVITLIIMGIVISSVVISLFFGDLSMKALLTGTSFVLAVFLLLLPFLIRNQIVIALGIVAKSHGWIVIWTFIIYECILSKGDPLRYVGLGMGVHYLGTICGQGCTELLRGNTEIDSATPLFALALVCMFVLVASYLVAIFTLNHSKEHTDINEDKNEQAETSSEAEATVHPFDRKVALAAERYNLTEREREIMWHLAKGYSSKAIQRKLFISASTVSAHSGNIYRKMNVHSKEEVGEIVRGWDDPSDERDERRASE